jgi:methylmalonyl-CoA/ethylmalonyl-CoA epimerase
MLQLLSAGRLFQIGIVVPDLRKALERYSGAYGLGPWIGFHFTPENVRDFTYRGRPADYSIELALTVDPSPQVELVQVHGTDSLYHEWIDRHGYGVQHLGVRVEDARAVTAEMVAAGYEVIQSGHGYGAEGDGMFVYFDTLADFGVITECIEVPKARRSPDFVWPPES